MKTVYDIKAGNYTAQELAEELCQQLGAPVLYKEGDFEMENELKIGQVVRLNSADTPYMTIVGLRVDENNLQIAGVAYINIDDEVLYAEVPVAALTGIE